jgi:hypothetical protein
MHKAFLSSATSEAEVSIIVVNTTAQIVALLSLKKGKVVKIMLAYVNCVSF